MKNFRAVLPRAASLSLLCASLTTLVGTALAQQGTFVPTGSLNIVRIQHTATLLNNGTVLIAGGFNNAPGSISSAELYDQTTGGFTLTGSMSSPRAMLTATLLNNGMVLIAGGYDTQGNSLASAELYDPATGTFTLTGSMTTARSDHTATLLNNGKVLVAGGVGNNSVFLASAEVYDPATGTFAATNSMNALHALHTATLLNNGTVLIAGGFDSTAGACPCPLATAELYDPAKGTFTLTGSMTTARFNHSATLLNNGTVLIAGGTTSPPSAIAELYNPTTASFTSTGSLSSNFSGQSAPLLKEGMVLLAGGGASIAELYDPASGIFNPDASLSIVLSNNTSTLLNNGTVLIAGGIVPTSICCQAGAELYELVAVSPTNLSFSNQIVVTTSTPQSVTFINNQSTALSITGIAINGTNASDFAETNNCPGSVAAGASCSIDVTFTPAATGSRTGGLNIANNLSGSPVAVPLIGTGIPPTPIASLSATSVVFPNQPFGSTSAAQTVTLRNTGTVVLNIQTVALAGANPGDFAIGSGSTCTNGTMVTPNRTCVLQLTFTPTASGTRNGTVSISDNALDSPEMIALSGSSAPTPSVSVTPSSITFPVQYVGTSGLPQSVTIENNGDGPLTIGTVTPSPADFAMLNACGSSLAAGTSCTIGVFFDPTASGARPGTLTINDNAPGSPHTVALSGIGQDFSLAPSGQATATITPGQTANYTLAVTPGGGFNQTVALNCSSAPAQSTCFVSPNPLVLNGSAAGSIAVKVTTTAASLATPTPSPPNRYRPLYLLYLSTELSTLLLLFALLNWRAGRRPRLGYGLALLLVFCAGVMMSGCGGGSGSGGGGGNRGTPAGIYTIVVSGTFTSGSTSLTHNVNLNLVVQ